MSIQTQLPWGAPVSSHGHQDELLLVQRDYVNLYDATLHVPIWSAEKLDPTRIGKVPRRINCFRRDPRLTSDQASFPSDYAEPIYDQGHLAPDADQDSSIRAALNTYVMSNMAPENCRLNRGIWQILESLTRLWARQGGTLYVLGGTIFDRDGDAARDPDDQADRMKSNNGMARVAIPTALFRVIARENSDRTVSTLAFILPREPENPSGAEAIEYLRQHIVRIEDIEQRTGLDLFPLRPILQQDSEIWPFAGNPPHSLCTEQPH